MVGKDITIGQYLAVETPLHRVDPRLKVIAVVVAIVMVFLCEGWALLALSGFVLATLVLLRLPLLQLLKSLKSVWVIVLVTFLLQIFLTPGQVVWRMGFLNITDTGLYNGAVFSGRVMLLVVLLGALTMTTPPLKLTDGLEWLLKPLKYLKVPVARVTTVVSIALMFIPNILEQSRKLIRAQMARGADFESTNVFRRVRDVVPVMVPLFVKVFHDSDELAVAMDSRLYSGGEGRTRLNPMKVGALEAVATLVFAAACIAIGVLI
jgi:energy-coupling factor transport system permease protein